MFFPYSTDAPIYYWPVVTIGLIVVNIAVFAAELAAVGTPGGDEVVMAWCLELGGGIHPLQWISSIFLHGGFMHLLGNMIFLWAFGLIVEGKIGWWRFLTAYLGIGAVGSMITQVISLGSEPNVGLGASGAIFGLLGMCLVWAPENDFSCILIIFIRPIFFDMQVRVFALIYLGLQVTILFLTREAVSSEGMHMLGAVAGFAVAVVMLRKDWVDCENWDLFSVWAGRHTMSQEQRDALDRAKREKSLTDAEKLARRQQHHDAALQQISALVDEGNVPLALAANARMAAQFDDWQLPEPLLYKLLAAAFGKDSDVDPVPLAVEYLHRHAKSAVIVRLKLAETLIRKQQRPAQALRVLAKLPPTGLSPKVQAIRQRLEKEAAAAVRSGLLEPAAEDW
jgi:membrane associated rhomboid family serine protease